MGKVVRLFENSDVQSILCKAADKGFTEIIVCGKTQDGTFELAKTSLSSSLEAIGALEMVKGWLLEGMDGA